jgi:hypothetical protein
MMLPADAATLNDWSRSTIRPRRFLSYPDMDRSESGAAEYTRRIPRTSSCEFLKAIRHRRPGKPNGSK